MEPVPRRTIDWNTKLSVRPGDAEKSDRRLPPKRNVATCRNCILIGSGGSYAPHTMRRWTPLPVRVPFL